MDEPVPRLNDSAPASPSPVDGDADPVRALLLELAALQQYVRLYVAARVDGIRVRIRDLFFVGVAAVLCVCVAVIAAVRLLLYMLHGISGGLSAALGDRPWLGDLLTGALGLMALAGVALTFVWRMRRKLRRERVARYEQRKAKLRRDVAGNSERMAAEAA